MDGERESFIVMIRNEQAERHFLKTQKPYPSVLAKLVCAAPYWTYISCCHTQSLAPSPPGTLPTPGQLPSISAINVVAAAVNATGVREITEMKQIATISY